MKRTWITRLIGICCLWVTGCSTGQGAGNISQVTYISDSGSILPELQAHEEIIITKNSVTFMQRGTTPDTAVEEGEWTVTVDEQKVAVLFAQLETVDYTTIERVEPEDPIDGGSTESYTIVYTGGKTFSMRLDPGTTYTNGELVTEPVRKFIQELAPPNEASVP